MPAIAIRHLSKTFEQKGNSVEALRDISLDIEEGDIYGIIGMSGAGKSTLVRCLTYLERPTSGEVIDQKKELLMNFMSRLLLRKLSLSRMARLRKKSHCLRLQKMKFLLRFLVVGNG